MTVLAVVVLLAVAIACMMVVNVAYIEMARTDLQTATDLSVKAAAVELGLSQDIAKMEVTANQVMKRHKLNNGRSPNLTKVECGALLLDRGNDRFSLSAKGNFRSPTGAVRLVAAYPAAFGYSMLPFPLPGSEKVQITKEATAGRSDVDLVLCIDRSASMAWGLSSTPFMYPNGTKGLDNYFRPPDSVASRWAAVRRAINTLTDTVSSERFPGQVHLGLVTFSSDFQFGLFHSKASSIDAKLSESVGRILEEIDQIGTRPIIGDTNIGAGLELVDSCRSEGKLRRVTGQKILVLMSDGLHTEGPSPLSVVSKLAEDGWTIHTISFSEQADKDLMSKISNIGNGMHYHASDANSLSDAFRDIALSLPGTLIN